MPYEIFYFSFHHLPENRRIRFVEEKLNSEAYTIEFLNSNVNATPEKRAANIKTTTHFVFNLFILKELSIIEAPDIHMAHG